MAKAFRQRELRGRGEALDGLIVRGLTFATGVVCVLGQIVQQIEEPLIFLADEKSVVGECLYRSCRSALRLGRANDRADGEFSAQKWCWLGHDEVRLQRFRLAHGQVGKSNRCACLGIHIGQRSSVAGLVLPCLKMHGLGRANAEQNSQDFRVGYPLRKRWIKTGPALLDERKVKSRREGDRFEMICGVEDILVVDEAAGGVRIVSGNCRPVLDVNGLLKYEVGIEIGILVVDAVPSPKGGVHVELHQVCESLFPAGPCRRTARDRGEVAEVHCVGTLRSEVCVDEALVGEFVICVVVDILRHIHIKKLKGSGVEGVSARGETRNFVVLGPSEFGVLLPEVALNNLSGSEKPENRRVSARKIAALFFSSEDWKAASEQPSTYRRSARCHGPIPQEGPPIRVLPDDAPFHWISF